MLFRSIDIRYNNFWTMDESKNKKSKIAAVPTHLPFFLEALYFGCWLIEGASKRKRCLHNCNFGLFVMSSLLQRC